MRLNYLHFLVGFACLFLLACGMLWFVWESFRINVPEKHVAVLMRKTGNDIENWMEIAPWTEKQQAAFESGTDISVALRGDDGYVKGIQQPVLGPGRYFYNPWDWDWQIVPMIEIPEGKLGVLIRKVGDNLPYKEIIAWKPNQKGIVDEVMRAGRYALNPYIHDVEIHDPVEVPAGYRGVRTLLTARMPANPNELLSEDNCRGVQKTPLNEGTYYVNPYIERVNLVDCRSQRFNLDEDYDMGFPSKDGFWVSLDGRLEYRIKPEEAARVFVTYNDTSNKDGLTDPLGEEIERKIIMPNARSFCRLRGSSHKGRDFIGGETRSAFQLDFQTAMFDTCDPLGVDVIQALITEVKPPEAIAGPVRDREVARQKLDQYDQQISQWQSERDLAVQEQLREQRKELVDAEREVVKVTVKAEEVQTVEVTGAEEKLLVSVLRLEAATLKAEAIQSRGKAVADVIVFKNQAEAAGWKEAVSAYDGDGGKYAQYLMYEKLAPAFRSIMANTASSPLMEVFKDFSSKENK